MSLERRFLKYFSTISVLVLAALLIAACGNPGIAALVNDGKITICHATSSTTSPYDKITIDFNELAAHSGHINDIIPVPEGGCPQVVETGKNVGKITICHATASATNPYSEITIDFNGLRGHSNHKGDIIPAPQSGCPSVTPTPATTATPTVTATPAVTSTPAANTAGNNDAKITICHATGSKKNSYVEITISVNGLNGHGNHKGDIIPAPAAGCPN